MTDTTAVARDQLRSFVERIERLAEEAKTIDGNEIEIDGNGERTRPTIEALEAQS